MLDGDATLGTGALVHANVLARLLGVRLLRVEADIILTPAAPAIRTTPGQGGLRALAPAPSERHRLPAGGQLGDARRLLADAEVLLGRRPDQR